MVKENFDTNSLNYPTNIFQYGLLYVVNINNNTEPILQFYIPHDKNINSPGDAVLAYRMNFSKSVQNFQNWQLIFNTDYNNILHDVTGYIVFNNRLIIQWKNYSKRQIGIYQPAGYLEIIYPLACSLSGLPPLIFYQDTNNGTVPFPGNDYYSCNTNLPQETFAYWLLIIGNNII